MTQFLRESSCFLLYVIVPKRITSYKRRRQHYSFKDTEYFEDYIDLGDVGNVNIQHYDMLKRRIMVQGARCSMDDKSDVTKSDLVFAIHINTRFWSLFSSFLNFRIVMEFTNLQIMLYHKHHLFQFTSISTMISTFILIANILGQQLPSILKVYSIISLLTVWLLEQKIMEKILKSQASSF